MRQGFTHNFPAEHCDQVELSCCVFSPESESEGLHLQMKMPRACIGCESEQKEPCTGGCCTAEGTRRTVPVHVAPGCAWKDREMPANWMTVAQKSADLLTGVSSLSAKQLVVPLCVEPLRVTVFGRTSTGVAHWALWLAGFSLPKHMIAKLGLLNAHLPCISAG